jgi:hypothetical protein
MDGSNQNGGGPSQSQGGSKKRGFHEISNTGRRDEDALFAQNDGGNYEGYDARQNGDEAQEDEGYADDVEANEYAGNSEDDDGEDILENMDRDYEHRPELDRYDARGIDDQL